MASIYTIISAIQPAIRRSARWGNSKLKLTKKSSKCPNSDSNKNVGKTWSPLCWWCVPNLVGVILKAVFLITHSCTPYHHLQLLSSSLCHHMWVHKEEASFFTVQFRRSSFHFGFDRHFTPEYSYKKPFSILRDKLALSKWMTTFLFCVCLCPTLRAYMNTFWRGG